MELDFGRIEARGQSYQCQIQENFRFLKQKILFFIEATLMVFN